MEFNIYSTGKIIEIWLTNTEKQSTAMLESFRPIFELHETKKSTV